MILAADSNAFETAWLYLAGHEFFGNTLLRWLVALLLAVVAWLVLTTIKAIVIKRLKALAERDLIPRLALAAEIAEDTKRWFVIIISIYLGSLALDLPSKQQEVGMVSIVQTIAIIALLIQAALWASTLVSALIRDYAKNQMEHDPAEVTTVKALAFVGRIVIWSVVLLLVLANIGVDITAMVAGLGVGGIAVALAAQNILGDLFASASIVLDKPFVLGDFIIVGDMMGSVENIGLKTTRVRSISGEQLIFSNTDLLQSRIRNFKRMERRRVPFALGVTYDTPADKLQAIPKMLQDIIEAREGLDFDRAHFKEFGDFSLNFEIVYYVPTPDYAVYMDHQQAINLAIYRRFAEQGIEFAFPTQTIVMDQPGGTSA